MKAWNKGIPHTKEHCNKLSQSHKGHPPWNKNISCTIETRKKISDSRKGYKNTEESNKKRRETSIKLQLKPPSNSGTKWYTNGIINKMCFSYNIPEGFYPGQVRIKTSMYQC
jgi:hypothetical protein